MPLWWAGRIVCAVCDHRWAGVAPVESYDDEPATGLQCPRCRSTSGVPIDQDEEADEHD